MKKLVSVWFSIFLVFNSCTVRYPTDIQPLTNAEMSNLVRHAIVSILTDNNKKSCYGGYVYDESGLLFYYEADLDTIYFEFSGFIKSNQSNQIDSGYFKMSVYGKNFYYYIMDKNFSSQDISAIYQYTNEQGDTISLHFNNQQRSLLKNKYFILETYAFYLLTLKEFYNLSALKIYLTKTPKFWGFYDIVILFNFPI